MNEKSHSGDYQNHNRGKRIKQKANVDMKLSGQDPGEGDLLHHPLPCWQSRKLEEYDDGGQKGQTHRCASYPAHQTFYWTSLI